MNSFLLTYTASQFLLWTEILVLLTVKWIVLAVIDFETYTPNFWRWSEWFLVRNSQSTFQCIRSAEGANWVRFTRMSSVETTFWSGFSKFRQFHAIFELKWYCDSLLCSLLKSADGLKLLGSRVSHKVPLARPGPAFTFATKVSCLCWTALWTRMCIDVCCKKC